MPVTPASQLASSSASSGEDSHGKETPYTGRARYFNSGNAFAIKHPPVPRHVFLAERDRAFAPNAATGLIDLDLSRVLQLPYPATSPLILARYARIRTGESIATSFRASGEVVHVLQGHGNTVGPDDRIEWKTGDTLFLPGGLAWTHAAKDDVVLYIVTNEPQMAFEGLEAPSTAAPGGPVHYPGERVDAELEALHKTPGADALPGYAVIFSHEAMEDQKNIHPVMTLAMNSLPPGKEQRPHRHNSVAITLCLESEGGYSITDNQRIDWSRHAVFVTPPGDVHAHYNEGPNLNRFLIIQDGGLHYHCRTMGFSYED